MKLRIIYILIICCVSLQNCTSPKQHTKQRYIQLNEVINTNIKYINQLLYTRTVKLKKEIKLKKYDQKLLNKLVDYEKLKNELIAGIDTYLNNKILRLSNNNPVSGFSEKNIPELQNKLDRHSIFIKQHFMKHISDTIGWSKKYLKFIPQKQRNNPPTFVDFYFKGASKEETMLILSTLQLGILQEALDIQQKILEEK